MSKWFICNDFSHVIPNKSGCYAIYKINYETHIKKLLYIGTSKNIYLRLKKHAVIRTLRALLEYPEFILIKCKTIPSTKVRIILEKKLINKLCPIINYE